MSVIIENGVVDIGDAAFRGCYTLTSITIPNSVRTIGDDVFIDCLSLPYITFPNDLLFLGSRLFANCNALTGIYFKGDAPTTTSTSGGRYIYYLPGTMGWTNPWGGYPTRLWDPNIASDEANFGVHSNRFEFTVTGSEDYMVAVEACSDLLEGDWSPVQTGTVANGSFLFSDPLDTNNASYFYRLSMP